MQLTDGAWEFNTDIIDTVITKPEHTWYERDMLNAFTRYAYYRYKQIRDKVNTRKCKHMTIEKILAALQDENVLKNAGQVLRISGEEIIYIVGFADKHLKYVK